MFPEVDPPGPASHTFVLTRLPGIHAHPARDKPIGEIPAATVVSNHDSRQNVEMLKGRLATPAPQAEGQQRWGEPGKEPSDRKPGPAAENAVAPAKAVLSAHRTRRLGRLEHVAGHPSSPGPFPLFILPVQDGLDLRGVGAGILRQTIRRRRSEAHEPRIARIPRFPLRDRDDDFQPQPAITLAASSRSHETGRRPRCPPNFPSLIGPNNKGPAAVKAAPPRLSVNYSRDPRRGEGGRRWPTTM